MHTALSPEKDDLSKKDVEDRRKKLEAVTRLKAKQRAEVLTSVHTGIIATIHLYLPEPSFNRMD